MRAGYAANKLRPVHIMNQIDKNRAFVFYQDTNKLTDWLNSPRHLCQFFFFKDTKKNKDAQRSRTSAKFGRPYFEK